MESIISTHPRLLVRQAKEWGEILTGWETRNRYQVTGPDGEQLFLAGELGGGLGALLVRSFLKSKRPFTMEVRDREGALALTIKRPWRWYFDRAEVLGPDGQPLGAVEKRFAFFARRYTVQGSMGETLAEIHGPFFRPWTFFVNAGGVQVAKIAKRWSGLLKEAFTDADTFGVELTEHVDPKLRPILLGATFLFDFVHFERTN